MGLPSNDLAIIFVKGAIFKHLVEHSGKFIPCAKGRTPLIRPGSEHRHAHFLVILDSSWMNQLSALATLAIVRPGFSGRRHDNYDAIGCRDAAAWCEVLVFTVRLLLAPEFNFCRSGAKVVTEFRMFVSKKIICVMSMGGKMKDPFSNQLI